MVIENRPQRFVSRNIVSVDKKRILGLYDILNHETDKKFSVKKEKKDETRRDTEKKS
jgi:hypothetical protein